MEILTGFCGEKYCRIGARIAGQLAKAMDGEVTMLYVRPRVMTTYFGHRVSGATRSSREEDEILEHGSLILKRQGVEKIRRIKRSGEPAREILKESARGYKLLITGTRDLKGIEKFLFGSISSEIAQYAKIPVLVVRRDVELKKFLLCTDGSEHALEAEYCAGYLAKRLGAEVTLFSVALREKPVLDFAREAVEKGRRMLEREFGVKAKVKVAIGDAAREILKEARDYDLVVLGSRGLSRIKRLLMGHVSLKVLAQAKTNVLIVRHCIMYEEKMK
jgi:nucleotide-binding universal stress UspA family protein